MMSIVEKAVNKLQAEQQNKVRANPEILSSPPQPEKSGWKKLLAVGGIGFILGAGSNAILHNPGESLFFSPPALQAKELKDLAKPAQILSVSPSADTENIARQQVMTFVDGWVKAWSEKDLDRYLYAYAPEFEPPAGLTRAAWEKQRRNRLGKYHKIEIKLSAMAAVAKGDTATIEFVQSFTADSFSEAGLHKRLELRRQGDRWMIVKEISQG
jgi:hypothetical protein